MTGPTRDLFQADSDIGKHMHEFMRDVFPICRSITGNGVRATLQRIAGHIPCRLVEVPTGTKVYDWTVPREWNISDAYIKNTRGERVVDFRQSNLHVLGYSQPFKGRVSLEELRKHLYTLPDHPDRVPYRTSYYNEDWGFCLSHNQYLELKDDWYDVGIDSSLEEGHLTYGECVLEGESEREILISTHICHPSLCNDNLSGVSLALYLAKQLSQSKTRYTYRFLFLPATIGPITWLATNESTVSKIAHGLVAANLGDSGGFTYKRSRIGYAEIDMAVSNALSHSDSDYRIIDFSPYGYDERQYCSPGFNLPVGCLMRTPHGEYDEYHTSADNLEFVKPAQLSESFALYLRVLYILEKNRVYVNQNPHCEPQLGKRGLYESIGADSHRKTKQLAMLWVLNLSDGNHSLLDISNRSELPFPLIEEAANILRDHKLLRESGQSSPGSGG